MLKVVSNFVNAIGAVNYKGTWNAATNNPALASGVGVKGDYYVVSTAGTTTIDGISTWYVGDWIVFNGTAWQRVQGGSDDPAPSLLSNSSTGLMQITGPGAGTTRVVTIPNANSTMARTDAAQSFTGDQTLATGNIIQGTAAKGVNFTANTPAAGMTSQLLNWYEQGNWTPTFTAATPPTGVTYSVQAGTYTRIGNMVNITCFLEISSVGSGGSGGVQVGGLPFAVGSATGNYASFQCEILNVTMPANANNIFARINPSATTIAFEFLDTSPSVVSAGRGAVQYGDCGNSFRLICGLTYRA